MALPYPVTFTSYTTGDPADLIDWSVVIGEDPTVIGTKTGRLQTTLQYVCPDVEHMHASARASYLSRLHRVLGTLGAGWVADWDWWHEEAGPYPASTWHEPTHWLVDVIRQLDYEEHPRYESTAYLTLSWAPQHRRHRWLDGLFLTTGHVRRQAQRVAAEVQAFQLGVHRFANLLRELMQVTMLDADATCTYLHRCVSWDRYPVRCPSPAMALAEQLTNTPFVPGQPPRLGPVSIKPFWVKTWGEELGVWLPVALEKMPFPCRWHVRWEAMGAQAAGKFLRRMAKQWEQSHSTFLKKAKAAEGVKEDVATQERDNNPEAREASDSLLAVRREVLTGQEALGMLTPTFLTWAEDPEQLEAQVRGLETVAFAQGLVIYREKAGASLGWIASLPGNVAVGIRGVPLRTQELDALMPHTSVWAGPERNAHLQGPPVMVASTDGTPFRLVTHVGELGHMMVAGPSRSGKSGFLGLLARQWFRYPGARVCIFDRDNALKATTVLGGGAHYALGTPDSPGFQPLAAIDSDEEKRWALSWLEGVLIGEGLTPTVEEREELLEMLKRVGGLPPAQRTMSRAREQLMVQRLKPGLAPFCEGGAYPFFDASRDDFGLQDTRMVCFEMSGLLDYPRALEAALSYTLHRLEAAWFDGSPVQIIIDEARWLLANPVFVGGVQVWLKARAKKNVAVTLSTQELVDIYQTSAWQAVLGSVPTWLFLPNHAAMKPDVAAFYHSVGLTEEELSLLVNAQPLRDYLYRSPLGTRVFQLRLSPVERLLCAASRMEELEVLDELRTRETTETLPGAWLRHWGHHDEADVLEKTYANARASNRNPEWVGHVGV